MLIFNTTFLVSPDIFAQWQLWMSDTYCPSIGGLMLTNGFETFEVMTVQEDGSRTFSVQWRCMDAEHLEQINEMSNDICGLLPSRFGDKCLCFSSVLKQFSLLS